MKNSKLSLLLSKLDEITATNDSSAEYSVETINDELSRNLKGGGYDTNNTSCGNSTNASCKNSSCRGSVNSSCSNGTC